MKEKLAKMGSLQRDNLFANADFRYGVINQRGKTTYNTIYSYGIDMWYMITAGTETVNANSISFSCDLKYIFEKQLPNGDYTFAVSVAGTIYKYTFKGFSGPSKTANITIGGKILGIELINNTFTLYANGSTHTIQFIKLEPGTEYTGMKPWDETMELLKCQSSLYPLKSIVYGSTGPRTNVVVMYCKLPIRLRKTPTITGNYTIKFRHTTSMEYWSVSRAEEVLTLNDGEILIALHIEGVQKNIIGECFIEGELYLDANNY